MFPLPGVWNRDSADSRRDERKRETSPASYFFAQGRSLVLAAGYFNDGRLTEEARGGVALKHRHRVHLALFGQLMASFEYMLKDFVAKAIDASSLLDARVQKAEWIGVDTARVLASRNATTTPGAMLVHASQGWHSPTTVNSRYQGLFERQPIAASESGTLERLWILRHSVAHNAGFVTQYDATRVGSPPLANRTVDINAAFIDQAFNFLSPIADRVANKVGTKLLDDWLASIRPVGKDYARDQVIFEALKYLSTYVPSRTQDLPNITEATYNEDFDAEPANG